MTKGKKWNSDLAEIGEKIRYWRRKRGFTQEQFAEKIGNECTGKKVSYWESGQHEIGVLTLIALAEALEVTPNELMPDRLSSGTDSVHNPGYNELNPDDRKAVDRMISGLLLLNNSEAS